MTKTFFSIFIFQALITIFFIFGGLYLLYLLFLVIRAFTELRSLPYMSKFFLLASRPLVFKVFRCQNQCLAKNIPHLPIKVLLTSLLLGAQIVPFKKKRSIFGSCTLWRDFVVYWYSVSKPLWWVTVRPTLKVCEGVQG